MKNKILEAEIARNLNAILIEAFEEYMLHCTRGSKNGDYTTSVIENNKITFYNTYGNGVRVIVELADAN